ncbi:MAG: histone family protein [Candidatus Ranarchaeia archaeon]
MKNTLPLAAMERLIKNSGAHRVADAAKVQMREVLEEIAAEISKQAISFAKHANRTTVKAEDIKLAAKQL